MSDIDLGRFSKTKTNQIRDYHSMLWVNDKYATADSNLLLGTLLGTQKGLNKNIHYAQYIVWSRVLADSSN